MSESEPRWTPGPAHVIDRIDQANHGRRVVASGRVVAECSALDPETNQANANLFANAEKLYEALRLMVSGVDGTTDECGASILANARIALAIARGEATP